MSKEIESSFAALTQLISEVSDKDLVMVAETIFNNPELEEERAAELFSKNLPFWSEFQRISTELDPQNANAMAKGASLLIAAMFRHAQIRDVAQILDLPVHIDAQHTMPGSEAA
jgi:hypothetical protein